MNAVDLNEHFLLKNISDLNSFLLSKCNFSINKLILYLQLDARTNQITCLFIIKNKFKVGFPRLYLQVEFMTIPAM